MFEGIRNGWDVITASIRVFLKYPIFLLPILSVWLIYAPTIVYLEWFYDWDGHTSHENLLTVFLVILLFSLLLTLSCSILLELIQQLETGKKFSISKALDETLSKNLAKIIPLSLLWATIWFILTIVEAMLRSKKRSEKEELSARNVAKKLSGYERISLWSLSIDMLNKGIRMMVFLTMPAFCWEDLGLLKSIKKGFTVLRTHLTEFATGVTLTYLAAVLVFIPPSVVLSFTEDEHVKVSDAVWFWTILYIAFAWSYTIYLEQMFVADLYLWHLKWEREYAKAKKSGKQLPALEDVPKPSILDEVPDLLQK